MPLRRPDHWDENLGEGLALEVVQGQGGPQRVARRGRGGGPEAGPRAVERGGRLLRLLLRPEYIFLLKVGARSFYLDMKV